MAGLEAIVGSLISIFLLQVHAIESKTILFAIMFLVGIGFFLGFFIVRTMGLPFFATFGDVINKNVNMTPQEVGQKPVPSRGKLAFLVIGALGFHILLVLRLSAIGL